MSPALLLALVSVLPRIPITTFMGCPQVHRLKSPASTPGYNIVFVSAGFQTPQDVENYRCAVAVLAKGLLDNSPWKDHTCQLGFYRMDFVDETRGLAVDDSCSDLPCNPQPLDDPPWTTGCPGILEHPFHVQDIWPPFFVSAYKPTFDVRHCRQNLCRFVWPSETGQEGLLAVVDRCVPPVQAIVVVANSTLRGGGGDASADDTLPGLAIVTVDEIGNPSAWRRLAHELGHVVGLLDEYAGQENYEAALGGFVCDRNVFKPPPPGGTNAPCGATASWEQDCSAHVNPDCGPDPNAACQTVVNPNCVPCDLQGAPPIALYEGAFGRDCGFFRSEDICLMRDYSAPACAVCESILDEKVDQIGGRCVLRYHSMRLRSQPRIDWDICPTPPRPPFPLGDERAPADEAVARRSENPVCDRRDLKLHGVYARVVGAGGLRGEVAVRRAWIESDTVTEGARLASVGFTRGADGSSRRLVLSLGDGPVSPLEWTAGIQLRAERTTSPVVKVIDDVAGAIWTAEEISLEVEVPD